MTGAPPSSAASATATPTAAPTPTAVATPSPLPSPSPAAAADLLVRLDVCSDTCVDPRREEYLADGRVIHLDLQTGRLVERRLSPAGLARVEARLASDADLLVHDLKVDPLPVPGKTPPGHGATGYTFIAPTEAGGRATVWTITAPSLDPGYWQPDPRIDRLTALGDALLQPETLAGADGWADPGWTRFFPSMVAVFVHVRDGVAPFSSPDLGATGWPFGGDPRTFGEPFASPQDAWPIARCAVMDASAADAAASRLPEGALWPWGATDFFRGGTAAWAQRRLELQVSLRAILPDQESLPCGELFIYG